MKAVKAFMMAVVALSLLTGPVFAAEKVAYLDLSRIFNDYGKTKDNDATLETAYNKYAADRDAKVEKIKEAQGKLALLKAEEKDKLQKDIEQMTADLNQFDQSERTELTRQRDEKIREILLEIEKIVSDYAKKEQISVVFNDRVLIYGSETLDITEPILKVLNDNYNKKE
ncbi:MAG: hypothetical protein COV67_01040 [Nitrospinae bacterium CG11_big_fil_rev_8_21_14_0_20_56_8]|nr:MAG: hypothetical protein COV67_01040 [Nitrospinae bacterium CG11_big_fil_rev_8_21_14_0_20_56_8]